MRRREITMATAAVASLIILVSFFYLAAPWADPPSSEDQSNPRVVFAPMLFILGLILLFLSPVVYELLPDEQSEEPDG